MDQGPLVTEQIEAGAKLAHDFDASYKPVNAAFWLKESDDGEWSLYLVSDQIDDSNFASAYGEVHRLIGSGSRLWLDPFQVKVRGADHAVAKDVMTIQRDYPDLLPLRLRTLRLGGIYVEEVYIYAVPITVTS